MPHNDITIMGQIADLKDINYKNTLAISALIELLIDKEIFSREDFNRQALALERLTIAEITSQRQLQLLKRISKK